jgi:hypothetical protein
MKKQKVLFSVLVFLSAFLLFQIQPLIGKYFLPFFGGASTVWMTTVFFFQLVLLFGYMYAERLSRLSMRLETRIHTLLTAVIGLIIFILFFVWDAPITPAVTHPVFSFNAPLVRVLLLLFVSTGLPYFLLSTTSSLIQHWHAESFKGESPYYLYALSNTGSLLGLVTYPILFEPFFGLHTQAMIWSIAFLIYAAGMLFLSSGIRIDAKDSEKEEPRPKVLLQERALWIILPFLGSLLLLTTTNQLTQGVASLPFLWVVPLTVYLLSFIISFSGKVAYNRRLMAALFLVMVGGVFCVEHFDYRIHFQVQILIYAFFLFCGTLLMHGELYRVRPLKEKMTSFYLDLSIGGALGGFFVTFIAPLIFKGYGEFYFCVAVIVAISGYILMKEFAPSSWTNSSLVGQWGPGVIAGICVLSLANMMGDEGGVSLKKVRNFYGVLDIRAYESSKIGPFTTMHHGLIKHGIQYKGAEYTHYPTAYFGPQSGVGTAIMRHPNIEKNEPMNIGVIGLGVGTLAAYGRERDTISFYELDPMVHTLANDYFSYLSGCKAKVFVYYGDGRQVLHEQYESGGSKKFDLFVIDAFTGGTIPIHLLTKEAFLLYDTHLDAEEGIIAINITNKYLNLVPQIKSLSVALGYTFVIIETEGDGTLNYDATWALLTKNKKFLHDNFVILTDNEDIEGCTLWSDSYSTMLGLIK